MTRSDFNARRFKDLELGYYFCLVRNTSHLSKTIMEISEEIEVRELEWSKISELKYFAPRRGNEEIVSFKKIEETKPSWKEFKKTVKI